MSKLVKVLLLGLVLMILSACGGAPTVPADMIYFYRNPDFVAPSLGVSTDFQLYSPDNAEQVAAIAKRYSSIYVESSVFSEITNLPVLKDSYAKVGPTELGLIDNYILPPGNYYRIPAQDVRLVPAAVVVDPNVGILRNANGVEPGKPSYTLLRPGIHRALTDQVRYFPTGPLRYRLISGDLLDRDKKGEIDACQSVLCETTLSDVLTKDVAVRVSVDLEVNFELIFDDEQLERLYQLQNIETLIRTYLSSPIRTVGRALWSDITPAEMQTGDGWVKMGESLTTLLNEEFKGQPIRLISVGIRGVDLPDDYLASQSNGAAAEQALQAQLRLAGLSQDATATASEFSRTQAQLETDNLAKQMKVLREAVNSDDPIVICGLINIFYPGSCVPSIPVSVSVDQSH